jgi:hypothetical protein
MSPVVLVLAEIYKIVILVSPFRVFSIQAESYFFLKIIEK